ncbi:hypothetical protein EDB83DRAFT_1738588 [Lactarius deliciosus]|nr:hypothetical protein EDB83DRAFT_1738588 [Lactarius deliciosus]
MGLLRRATLLHPFPTCVLHTCTNAPTADPKTPGRLLPEVQEVHVPRPDRLRNHKWVLLGRCEGKPLDNASLSYLPLVRCLGHDLQTDPLFGYPARCLQEGGVGGQAEQRGGGIWGRHDEMMLHSRTIVRADGADLFRFYPKFRLGPCPEWLFVKGTRWMDEGDVYTTTRFPLFLFSCFLSPTPGLTSWPQRRRALPPHRTSHLYTVLVAHPFGQISQIGLGHPWYDGAARPTAPNGHVAGSRSEI